MDVDCWCPSRSLYSRYCIMTLWFDGSHTGYGYILGREERFFEREGNTLEAEYLGLIAGLEAARVSGVLSLDIAGDSRVLIDQIMGRSSISENLKPFHMRVISLLDSFPGYKLRWIPGRENPADRVSRRKP